MKRSTVVKLSISGALLFCAAAAVPARGGAYAVLILLGMACGTHGDFCLAKIPALGRLYRQPFIAGAVSFMCGHAFYIAAFVTEGRGAWHGPALLAAFCVYACAAFVVWFKYMRSASALLKHGALVYAFIIAAMAACALAFPLSRRGLDALWWTPAAGGVLFILSDALIAINAFGGKRLKHADAWIWLTYAPAQALIILSAWRV